MNALNLFHILRLVRIDSSLIASVVVFIPAFVSGAGLEGSLGYSIPILTSAMSGFVLNDLHDIERDTINHPDRPIPGGHISKTAAMALYFGLLFLTLATVKAYVPLNNLFIYLLFFILLTNYNFVVERFPYMKNPYVALTTIIPIVIAQRVNPGVAEIELPVAVGLFIFGREVLMDVIDAKGDGKTLVKGVGHRWAVKIAFGLQLVAVGFLVLITRTAWEWAALGVACIILASSMSMWKIPDKQVRVIWLMKVTMAACLVYLVN